MSGQQRGETLELPSLAALRGEDEKVAREAFDLLWEATHPALTKQLARQGLLGEEAADVAQETALRLWERRRTVHARTTGEWRVLSWRVARRNALNHRARASSFDVGIVDEDGLPDREAWCVDVLLAAEDRRKAFVAADRIWLGQPILEDERTAEAVSAVLALVLAEGMTADRAARMFDHPPSSVDRWLTDPALVARAAFATLCWPGEDIAAFVLRPELPLEKGEIRLASQGEGKLSGWSAIEARAICLREIHGMDEAAITRSLVGQLTELEATLTLSRAVSRYPFREAARAFRRALGTSATSLFPDMSLWKRVAFEYAVHGLGRDHIVERAGPPAEEFGKELTRTTLDNWLGRGRLYARLAAELTEAA